MPAPYLGAMEGRREKEKEWVVCIYLLLGTLSCRYLTCPAREPPSHSHACTDRLRLEGSISLYEKHAFAFLPSHLPFLPLPPLHTFDETRKQEKADRGQEKGLSHGGLGGGGGGF